MKPHEKEFLDQLGGIINKYLSMAAQMSSEMIEYQNSLELERIFDPARLMEEDERTSIRGDLSCFNEMFGKYKKFYETFVLKVNEDILECHSELPEEDRNSLSQGMVTQLQDQLDEQAYFYSLRERWVVAVLSLLSFFDENIGQVDFDGEQILIDDDSLLDHFNEILAEVDEVAQLEAQLMAMRHERILQRAKELGIS